MCFVVFELVFDCLLCYLIDVLLFCFSGYLLFCVDCWFVWLVGCGDYLFYFSDNSVAGIYYFLWYLVWLF